MPNPPQTWADLTKPEYKGQVTLNGDPREAGAAFAAVMAASLANGGSFDDIMPGIQYFAGPEEGAATCRTLDVTEAAVLSGDVPIALDWTYNFPGSSALQEAGFAMQVVVPSDGVYGDATTRSPSSPRRGIRAPHGCCWSTSSATTARSATCEGGAIPARYAALDAAGKITADMKKNLPPADLIAKVAFPTQAQTDAAKQLAENWGPMVADL